MGWALVGCSYFLIHRARGGGESEPRVWNSLLLCAWARVNSVIIFWGGNYVLQCWQAGRWAHPASDNRCSSPPNGRCDPIPSKAGSNQRAPLGWQDQNQQTRKPLTREERENKMEEVVETGTDEGRMIHLRFSQFLVFCHWQVFFLINQHHIKWKL